MRTGPSSSLQRLAIALPVAVFVAVYGLRAGHGFVQDDYEWVRHSWVHSPADVARLLTSDNGFYRPVVSLSFAVNAWLFGASPVGYGLTNVLLALGCAVAIVRLARACNLPPGAAAMAGVVWLMNFYFTKTAVLWISGRTSLIATLFAALCATALLRGRIAVSLLCLAVALFSKEEALLLPVILTGWILTFDAARREPRRMAWIAGAGGLIVLYLAARSLTGAMTPQTAPAYYRFTFDPTVVIRNIAEYADRTSTLAVAAILGAVALLGYRQDGFDRTARRAIMWGLLWLVVGLGFAYVLPVRSDLYAAMPAVGSSLAAAAVGSALWKGASEPARGRALAFSLAVWLLLAPIYWARSERMVHVAEFSAARLEELAACLRDVPATSSVRIDDVESHDPRTPNLAAAFGGAIEEAYAVRTGREMTISLVEPGSRPLPAGSTDSGVRYVLQDGHLRPMTPGS